MKRQKIWKYVILQISNILLDVVNSKKTKYEEMVLLTGASRWSEDLVQGNHQWWAWAQKVVQMFQDQPRGVWCTEWLFHLPKVASQAKRGRGFPENPYNWKTHLWWRGGNGDAYKQGQRWHQNNSTERKWAIGKRGRQGDGKCNGVWQRTVSCRKTNGSSHPQWTNIWGQVILFLEGRSVSCGIFSGTLAY